MILMAEALTVHRQKGWYPSHSDLYSQGVLDSLRYSERIHDGDLLVAREEVGRLVAGWIAAMEDVDVLMIPASPVPAPDPPQGPSDERALSLMLTRPCLPVSMCGLGSVAAPCGFSHDGLPLGVQFIARDEATALVAAVRYQELAGFHECRPSL